MTTIPDDFPRSLRSAFLSPLQGEELKKFYNALKSFDIESKEDWDKEIDNPDWLKTDEPNIEDMPVICDGLEIAVNRALARSFVELIQKNPQTLDFNTFIEGSRYYLTNREWELINFSYLDQGAENPNRDEEMEEAVSLTAEQTLNLISNCFYLSLSRQSGKLNSYLFERLMCCFIRTTEALRQLAVSSDQLFVGDNLESNNRAQFEDALFQYAEIYIKSSHEFKQEKLPVVLNEGIEARVKMMLLTAATIGQLDKFIDATNFTLAGKKFLNCDVADLVKIGEHKEEICYDFDQMEFIRTLEQNFLRSISPAKRTFFDVNLRKATMKAAESTGLDIPSVRVVNSSYSKN